MGGRRKPGRFNQNTLYACMNYQTIKDFKKVKLWKYKLGRVGDGQ